MYGHRLHQEENRRHQRNDQKPEDIQCQSHTNQSRKSQRAIRLRHRKSGRLYRQVITSSPSSSQKMRATAPLQAIFSRRTYRHQGSGTQIPPQTPKKARISTLRRRHSKSHLYFEKSLKSLLFR